MTDKIQKLELVDDRFPALFTGEKTDTIRWQEGPVEAGYLLYYASQNTHWQALVWVTKVHALPLAELASRYNMSPEALLKSMQRHYPTILQDSEVLLVEHLTPQQTETIHGIPKSLRGKVARDATDLTGTH